MNPSLLITPNSGEAGKLFSIIPTNGTGDLDVVRATSATRVNSAGLIEIPVTNLALQSDMFANAAWNKILTSATANTIISPSGVQDADTIVANGANGFHYIFNAISLLSATNYTISVYAKKNTNDFLQVTGGTAPFGSNFFANFDLNNGTIGTVGSAATASIQSIGNGWYRCIVSGITINATTNDAGAIYGIVTSANSVRAETNTLSTSVYLWGAQLEQGVTVTEYIPTTTVVRTRFAGITQDGSSASNIPRLDYTNGSCPSILVEPQRTNLYSYSNSFINIAWAKSKLKATYAAYLAPNDNQDCTLLSGDGTLGQHYIYQGGNFTNGVSYTTSIYVKRNTNNYFQLCGATDVYHVNVFANFDLLNGVVGTIGSACTAQIREVRDGWYKCTITGTAVASISGAGMLFCIVSSTTSARVEQNSSSTSVFVWGAQVEAGSNATSYIPTTTTSVTRNADVISKTGISSLIGQTQGTLYWEGRLQGQSFSDGIVRMLLSISDGTVNNRLEIYRGNNIIQYDNIVGGAVQFSAPVFTITDFTGQPLKLAITYTLNNVKVFINGVLVNTDTTALIPTCGQTNIGSNRFGSGQWSGLIKNTLFFKTALTNAQAIQLTTL